MGYVLGIDLGTTFTAAAIRDGAGIRMIGLSHDRVAIPSVVAPQESGVLVGDEAGVVSATAPWNVAREFKRRFGDPTPMYIDGKPYSPERLMGDLLEWVVRRVRDQEGGSADGVVVTHPATWGAYKLDLLRSVAAERHLSNLRFVSEPEAAAAHYNHRNRVEAGSIIAVYDLGGGTFDVTVLERSAEGFVHKGVAGVERAGGLDLDDAVFGLVIDAISDHFDELDQDDPATQRAVMRLREECTRAKVGLSYDTRAIVPVVLPGLVSEVLVQRSEFERLVEPLISRTVATTTQLIERSRLPNHPEAVLLVGGSSRVPIVSQLLTRELGIPVAIDTHPKHAVALGAAVTADPAQRARPLAVRASYFADTTRAEIPELPGSTVRIPKELTTSIELKQRYVVVLSGERGGRTIDLPAGSTVVGRHDVGETVGLQSPLVSRTHLEVRRDGTTVTVRDLDSTNGTMIDGVAVGSDQVAVEPGTIIDVGGTLLLVDGPGAQMDSVDAVTEAWSLPELQASGLGGRLRRGQASEWLERLQQRRPALMELSARLRRARRFQNPGAAVLRFWSERLPSRLAQVSTPPGSVVLGWSTRPSPFDTELLDALPRSDRRTAFAMLDDLLRDPLVPLVVPLLGETTVVRANDPMASAIAQSILLDLELASPSVSVSARSNDRGGVTDIRLHATPVANSIADPALSTGVVRFVRSTSEQLDATALISVDVEDAEYRSGRLTTRFVPSTLATQQ